MSETPTIIRLTTKPGAPTDFSCSTFTDGAITTNGYLRARPPPAHGISGAKQGRMASRNEVELKKYQKYLTDKALSRSDPLRTGERYGFKAFRETFSRSDATIELCGRVSWFCY